MENTEKTERVDAWSDEHDAILADVIIKNKRQGYTLIKSFEEAAEFLSSDKLTRTKAACQFRWSNGLKQKYAKEYEEAKAEAEKNKKTTLSVVRKAPKTSDVAISLEKEKSLPLTRVQKSASSFSKIKKRTVHNESTFVENLKNHLDEYVSIKNSLAEAVETISFLRKEVSSLKSEAISNQKNSKVIEKLEAELRMLRSENDEYREFMDVMERTRELRERTNNRISEINEDVSLQNQATG
jgi:RsfA family transcription factor